MSPPVDPLGNVGSKRSFGRRCTRALRVGGVWLLYLLMSVASFLIVVTILNLAQDVWVNR